jgi:hypothetical protein
VNWWLNSEYGCVIVLIHLVSRDTSRRGDNNKSETTFGGSGERRCVAAETPRKLQLRAD